MPTIQSTPGGKILVTSGTAAQIAGSCCCGAQPSSCPNPDDPEMKITITAADAKLPITWCGYTWLKSTTAKSATPAVAALQRYSGNDATICPSAYYKGKVQTTYTGTYKVWQARNYWVNSGLVLRREVGYGYFKTPNTAGYWFRGGPGQIQRQEIRLQPTPATTYFRDIFALSNFAMPARPNPPTVSPIAWDAAAFADIDLGILALGLATTSFYATGVQVASPTWSNYDFTALFLSGSFVNDTVTYTWARGNGW